MRYCLRIIAALLPLLAAACSTESLPEDKATVTVALDSPSPGTKSILPGTSAWETAVNNCLFIAIDQDGAFQHQYKEGADLCTPAAFPLIISHTYKIYALVNMGNVLEDIPREGGTLRMDQFRYEIPSFTGMGTGGIPMAGSHTVIPGSLCIGVTNSRSIPVRRLLAKVTVTVDKSDVTSGEDTRSLLNRQVSAHNVCRALYPFMPGGSRAIADEDIFTDATDRYSFPASGGYANTSEQVTFYVPENIQGICFPGGESQYDKTREVMLAGRNPNLCTYIRFNSEKYGDSDGVSGELNYRCYLGEDEYTDCSVIGNKRYDITLSLTWNGFWVNDGWRIEQGEDWSDARRIEVSPTYSAIVPGASTTFNVTFWRDSDSAPAYGVREEYRTFPFAWNFSLEELESNHLLRTEEMQDGITYTYIPSPSGADRVTFSVPEDEALVGRSYRVLFYTRGRAQVAATTINLSAPSINITGDSSYTWGHSQSGPAVRKGFTVRANFSLDRLGVTNSNNNDFVISAQRSEDSYVIGIYPIDINSGDSERETVITLSGPLGLRREIHFFHSSPTSLAIEDPEDGGEGNNTF